MDGRGELFNWLLNDVISVSTGRDFLKNQAQVCSLLRVHLDLYNESQLTPLCVTRMPPFWWKIKKQNKKTSNWKKYLFHLIYFLKLPISFVYRLAGRRGTGGGWKWQYNATSGELYQGMECLCFKMIRKRNFLTVLWLVDLFKEAGGPRPSVSVISVSIKPVSQPHSFP